MLKFFQLLTFYDGYLAEFYSKHPEVATLGYEDHLRILVEDGFGGGHVIAPYLNKLGYKAGFTVVNSKPLQESWCRENGQPSPTWPEGEKELALRQVEAFAPDVLYLCEPLGYDSSFVRRLKRLPRLTLGWRAARITPNVDWSSFDAILSSSRHCLKTARERGARDSAYSLPGFAPSIASKVLKTPKLYDVVFCGSFTPDHEARNALLTEIAKAPLGIRGDITPAFFMYAPAPEAMPSGIAMHDHGPRWGLPMYQALASGRIVLNAHIDIADGEAPNMRMFEATGCGSFLLTERQYNLEAFFRPGVEIETFSDTSEMLDKIYYYLSHPKERETIAARGHERCMRDYTQDRRALAMDRFIHERIGTGPRVQLLDNARLAPAGSPTAGALSMEYCRERMPVDGDEMGKIIKAVQREVEACPENDRLRHFLSGLLKNHCTQTQ